MNKHTCKAVSTEELIAYADGELPQSEAEQIAEHIARCAHCQAVVEALERSLRVTQAIWQTSHARWPKTQPFDRIRSNRLPYSKAIAVAASILLISGAGAMWRLLSKPSKRARTISEETKLAELRLKIADSSDAARLLAAAELLSRYPETSSSVEQRYRHIVETYPKTAAAAKARLRMQ